MKKILLLMLLLVACNSPVKDIEALVLDGNYQDCGSIDNPYALAESYFRLDEIVYLRLNFVQFICTDTEIINIVNNDWDKTISYINTILAPTKVQFVKNFVGYEYIEDIYEINDFRKHLLLVEEELRAIGSPPAITMMLYPSNVNWWPGAAVGIPSTGFALQQSYLQSTTTIHEILHCLGLKHTHEPDPTDGKNYATGDNICDLAYHPPMISGTIECTLIKDPQRQLTREEQEKLVTNYMSYTDKFCRDNLSPVQIDRIRKTIEVTPALLNTMAFPNLYDRITITNKDRKSFKLNEL